MNKRNKIATNNKGFTILELLISSMIFSVVILLCTFGLIEIGRNYYKGSTQVRTQNIARSIIDDITQAIQFGSNIPANLNISSGNGTVCLGSKFYSYNITQNTGHIYGTTDALKVQRGCPGVGTAKEMLGKNMQLWNFTIKDINNDKSDYAVTIKVVYGDNDLIDPTTGLCKGGAGQQFCATSELSTTVRRRVN